MTTIYLLFLNEENAEFAHRYYLRGAFTDKSEIAAFIKKRGLEEEDYVIKEI
jgi:hypothetical protein